MNRNVNQLLILICVALVLTACNLQSNQDEDDENLINKGNVITNQWINYEGLSENDKSMIQTQFIPYNPKNKYEVSHDTYISYFNGEKFIKTELYEDTPETILQVEAADGVILSFNKENKSGMQLTQID